MCRPAEVLREEIRAVRRLERVVEHDTLLSLQPLDEVLEVRRGGRDARQRLDVAQDGHPHELGQVVDVLVIGEDARRARRLLLPPRDALGDRRRKGRGAGGEVHRVGGIHRAEPSGECGGDLGHAFRVHVVVGVAHGVHVPAGAVGGLALLDEVDLGGPLEVAALAGQDLRVGRALERGGQPADLELGSHRHQDIGAPQRHHHAGPGEQVVGVAVGRGEDGDLHRVAPDGLGEHPHARGRGDDVDGGAGWCGEPEPDGEQDDGHERQSADHGGSPHPRRCGRRARPGSSGTERRPG